MPRLRQGPHELAGVPMLDTIAITGDISGNLLYKKMWRNVYAAVKQGKKAIADFYKMAVATGAPQAIAGQKVSAASTFSPVIRSASRSASGPLIISRIERKAGWTITALELRNKLVSADGDGEGGDTALLVEALKMANNGKANAV